MYFVYERLQIVYKGTEILSLVRDLSIHFLLTRPQFCCLRKIIFPFASGYQSNRVQVRLGIPINKLLGD
jgi:hypothetical protein